jgi:predicted Zn-ribbon and HTH transcriptional regulator
MSILNSYRGATVVLPTLHNKGVLAQEAFKEHLDMDVIELHEDTDQFGTFSGDVERKLSPKESAIAKAKLGLTQTDYQYALASEGTIGADPTIPFANSDLEVVVFLDSINDLIISHTHHSFEISACTHEYIEGEDLEKFLTKADFPNHQLIVKCLDSDIRALAKGISNRADLMKVLDQTKKEGLKKIVIESDLRAHASPSRAQNIKQAFKELAIRISSLCPECESPGWGVTSAVRGLPCTDCGEESDAIKAHVFGCISCSYVAEADPIATSIDPSRCSWCNP